MHMLIICRKYGIQLAIGSKATSHALSKDDNSSMQVLLLLALSKVKCPIWAKSEYATW